MLNPFLKIIIREWYLIRRQPSQWCQPSIFLILMGLLPSMVIGSSISTNPLLPAILIVLAVVYATMLTLDKTIRQDYVDGVYTQWLLSPWPMWWLMLAKGWAHWIFWVLPMVLISPIIMLMLGLEFNLALVLLISLLIGSPLLSFVGMMSSSLTLNLNASGFLLALIMLPLIVPMVLFSLAPVQSILINQSPSAGFALLGAITILSCVLCPIGCAFGVRVSQSCGNI